MFLAVLKRKQRRDVDELYPHRALSRWKIIFSQNLGEHAREYLLRPGILWKFTQVEEPYTEESGSLCLGFLK